MSISLLKVCKNIRITNINNDVYFVYRKKKLKSDERNRNSDISPLFKRFLHYRERNLYYI